MSHLHFQMFKKFTAITRTFLLYKLHPNCQVWQKPSPPSHCSLMEDPQTGGWEG